jgi:acetyltransferase-like isoleucine patch superfamily enzyme
VIGERLRSSLARRLGHGFLGKVAREGVVHHPVVFGDRTRVRVDPTATVNDALFNSVSGAIEVGPHAFFGHGVSLLTGTHDASVTSPERAMAIPREGRDIVVGEGAWIASNATVLGPCTIGAYAVVAAGAVVVEDVPAYAVVGGVPARVVVADVRPERG